MVGGCIITPLRRRQCIDEPIKAVACHRKISHAQRQRISAIKARTRQPQKQPDPIRHLSQKIRTASIRKQPDRHLRHRHHRRLSDDPMARWHCQTHAATHHDATTPDDDRLVIAVDLFA